MLDSGVFTAKDVEANRDILMAMAPERSGVLRVKLAQPTGSRIYELPKVADIQYCSHMTIEKGIVVYWFDIPEGAPRRLRQDTRNGVTRMVSVEAVES